MKIVSAAGGNTRPDATVALLSRNRREMLLQALQTVMAQDLDATVEVLVIDNASSDESASAVQQRFPGARLLRQGKNLGVAGGRNLAVELARGPVLAFLDDDDLWDPRYLHCQLEALESQRSLLNACAILVWDVVRGRKIYRAQHPDLRRYRSPLHQMLVDNFIVTSSSIVFATELFRRIGAFDASLRHGSDGDLYTRCLLAGLPPTYLPEALATWRVHGDQLTGAQHLDWRRAHEPPRFERFAAELNGRPDIPPLAQMRAEADARDARRHLSARRWGSWLGASLHCARKGYPGLALRSAAAQIAGETLRALAERSAAGRGR